MTLPLRPHPFAWRSGGGGTWPHGTADMSLDSFKLCNLDRGTLHHFDAANRRSLGSSPAGAISRSLTWTPPGQGIQSSSYLGVTHWLLYAPGRIPLVPLAGPSGGARPNSQLGGGPASSSS